MTPIKQEFNRNFDKQFENQKKLKSACVVNGILRLVVEKENDIVELQSFYPSGNKTSFKKTKNGKPFELACEWYENGNLSVKEELQDGYKNYVRTTYFKNGNDHIRISTYDYKKTYDRWFESGKKEVEFIEDIGYVYYNENGEKIRTVN